MLTLRASRNYYGYICVTMVTVNFRIKELLQPDSRSPFGAWFAVLDVAAAAKVSVAVARIEQRKQNESKGK